MARNWITDKIKGAAKKVLPSSWKSHGRTDAAAKKAAPTPNGPPNNNFHSPAPARKPTLAAANRYSSYGHSAMKATGRSADSESSNPLHINTKEIGQYVHNASEMACKYARKIVHLCDLSDQDSLHAAHV